MVATAVSGTAQLKHANTVNQNPAPLDNATSTHVVRVEEVLQILDGAGPMLDGQIAP